MKLKILGLVAAIALSGTAFAQTTAPDTSGSNPNMNTQRTDDTHHHDYGWLGLLGLAGLAGLRKQDHNRAVETRTGTAR